MKVNYGAKDPQYGPGVEIHLSGNEVACAIDAYLVAHGIVSSGPRTVTVNNALCEKGMVYVDSSGFVIANGVKWSGRGEAGSDEFASKTFHPNASEIIIELMSNNVVADITTDKKTLLRTLMLTGFYKCVGIKLIETDNDEFIAYDRYGDDYPVKTLYDIVKLNNDWWQFSKDRSEVWKSADSKWVGLLLKFGF